MLKTLISFFVLHLFLFPSCFGKVSQVHISLTGVVSEMLVNWVSESPQDLSVASYGLTSSPDRTWMRVEGNVTSYSFEGYTSGGLHNALLTRLKPATVYYYVVGDGDKDVSEVFSFKSCIPPGTGPVTFAAIGDVGADPNSTDTFHGLLALKKSQGFDLVNSLIFFFSFI